ncbi:unnamed protein product [Lepeophtheirus salmonis]|uniref:(salmon louse) hypothetical protein n=1 Tax=Lepeophtheirus salmonis TaxID=72036 RepID=A0A7R8H421_LEPSM|nr:unnamed protein product [Lepeophtheirus salmonis]CAF2840805.1 unnamed protein product [Lepeophtheirus salmonis]
MNKGISVCCLLLILFVINGKTQRYQHPGSSLNHGPPPGDEVSSYNSLLQNLNLLIPRVQRNNKEPNQIQLLHNLLNMIKFLALKLLRTSQSKKNDPKAPQYILLKSTVDEALQFIAQKGTVEPKMLSRIANQLAQLFQEENKVQNDEFAPYCEPGTDCFLDVDHAGIYGRVNGLAKKVSDYIKYRNKELQAYGKTHMVHPGVQVQIQADDILAHTTILLQKLHRSVMRNWHHILMIVGNLAGNDGGAIRLLGNPNVINPRRPINTERSGRTQLNGDENDVDNGVGTFQCKIFIKGNPIVKLDTDACSSEIKPWFKNTNCVSPIRNSDRDCSPSFSGGKFARLQGGNIGFQSSKRGIWNYHLEIKLDPVEDFNITNDLAVGRVDIITSHSLQKSLLHINNKMSFGTTTHASSSVSKLLHEGSDFLEKEDIILLRIAKVKSDMTLTFSAEFTGSKKTVSSNQNSTTHSKPSNYVKNKVENESKKEKQQYGRRNQDEKGFTDENDTEYEVDPK